MTAAYKLLGVPRTLDEFAAKAKRKGVRQIKIKLEARDLGGLYSYHCYAVFTAGKTRFKSKGHKHIRFGLLYETIIGKLVAERDTLKEVIEAADKLLGLGFGVVINGEPVEDMRSRLERYDLNIKEMSNKHGVPIHLVQILNM